MYRPALKNLADKIPDAHTLAQSLIKSQSSQRNFFKFQERNTQKRDLAKQFQSINKHSAKEETNQAKIEEQSSSQADAQTKKTSDQLIKERNQNLKRQSNEAFQQQSKRLDQEFQEQRKKQHLGIFDVFSDIKSGVGSSFKKSGEYISELKHKASEKLNKKQEKKEIQQESQAFKAQQPSKKQNKVQEDVQNMKMHESTQQKSSTQQKPVEQQHQKPQQSKEQRLDEQANQQIKKEPRKLHSQRGQSIKDKISGYGSKFTLKVQKQAPSLYKVCSKYGGHIQQCWNVTFPNKQRMARQKIQQNKVLAENALSAQEIQKIQLDIPEFKRHALVISQQKDPVKKRSLIRKLRQNVRERVRKTELYQQIKKGQNYKKYEQFKQDFAEFKQNLRDQIDSSPNKFVAIGRQVYDRATSQSKIGSAILKMRKLNPNFEFDQLIFEIPEIVHPLYSQYLDGNIEFIQKCCEQQALAYLKSRVKARRNKKMVPKFNVPLYVDQAYFLGGKIGQNNLPQFIYSLRIQEIGCLVDFKDQSKIVQGNEDLILGSHFRLTVQPHDSPDVKLTGHNWKFVQFEKIAEVEQLV